MSTRGSLVVAVLLAGLGGLHGPGCSSNATDQTRTGEGAQLKGSCIPADDDDDPCTVELCKGMGQEHMTVPGMACGKSASLQCDTNGQCIGCSNDEQCGEPTECAGWRCEHQVCVRTYLPQGAVLALQLQEAHDCKQRQCDGKGGRQEMPYDDAPLQPQNVCHMATCIDGAPTITDVKTGTPCELNGKMGYCFEGQCYRCDDKEKNGNESDEDCGGSCAKCKQGQACNHESDCEGAQPCVDGVCCENACGGTCKACNWPGFPGQCVDLPAGEIDTYADSLCSSGTKGKVCALGGGCTSTRANHESCDSHDDCASGACILENCKQNDGLCQFNSDCASNNCIDWSHKCTPLP